MELYTILGGLKNRTEAYKYFGFHGNSKGILRLKEIANSVGFDLKSYDNRMECNRKCKICNKLLNNKQYKFCSRSCSAKYSNQFRILTEDTKNKIRIAHLNKPKKNKKIKLCKICGQEICTNIEICKLSKYFFNNLIYFGFDINYLGTVGVYDEYDKIRNLLIIEYIDNELSPKDISNKYNYPKKSENILHLLKLFNIKTRNISESQIVFYQNNYVNRYMENTNDNYQFKHGWHITWNNKKIYYRSSYELNYAKKLDIENIDYETESLRIKYLDTNKQKYRTAIPDFYIPDKNLIVEIKSRFTFNKQNIINKFTEYVKLGFFVLLIFEKKEYSFDELININQHKQLIGNKTQM